MLGTLSSLQIGQAIKPTYHLLLIALSTLIVAMTGAFLTKFTNSSTNNFGNFIHRQILCSTYHIKLSSSLSQHKTSASSFYLLCYHAGRDYLEIYQAQYFLLSIMTWDHCCYWKAIYVFWFTNIYAFVIIWDRSNCSSTI